MKRGNFLSGGKFITSAVVLIVFFLSFDTFLKGYSQTRRRNEIKEETTFKRPAPSRPIKPEVPGVNRYQEDKVFLEYADSLYKTKSNDTIERQILKGSVKFRQAGLWMFCDSAYYYPEINSLDAFSNVRMEQGDTLFVYADKLFYNGDEHLARLKNGPTEKKVRLINNDVTLTTDSLDYDMSADLGWYTKWGTIEDAVNTLTSLYGEYSPATKKAEFYKDVVLVNHKDGFTMLTDTLHYNTETHIAEIDSPTEIQSENDTILTTYATYFTDSGDAELLARSTILHKDSTGNVTTLEGDSIIYDNTTRISRVYMFRDPFKRSAPMVLTDTAQKTTLIGGFGIYNDSTKEALSTIYPLLLEYSQGDTLFLRADTIRTFLITEMVPDTRKKTPYPEVKGKPIIFIDSLNKIWVDPVFFSVQIPDIDLPLKKLEEIAPSAISIINKEEQQELDSLPLVPKDFHVALAYHRGRFFKQDIQGVADSMVFVERDSMLYLFRKPIIWNEERQVTGNRIDVHFNDSTTDWAYLPEYGLISEHIDEDFYNQITGKEITAYFEGETLKRLNVEGNVETIFLPQESDSTYNRLVEAESSYLEIFLKDNKMDWLKMWPEVSGKVTPIFMVKNSQKYLRRFKWWSFLRPQREWYGNTMRWADNLGEVPDELEQYFLAPSDFGEPKTFSGARFTPPPSSLYEWDEIPAILPDSLDTGSESAGVEKVESSETLEQIEITTDDLEKENQTIEEEAEEIGEAVLKEKIEGKEEENE
ncbi:MAG: LPS export ABC transporter periplasmic protein LptC [Muribaculaceae bacterium]|nr:LPS export ABC transporter periplasmic protein LptC [Muribaculaceae bacterium]